MDEDAPLEPVTGEPVTEATDAAPTEPVAVGAEPGPPPWPAPATQQQTRTPGSSTVAVPKWLLLVVGAIVIAAIGFGVGYAVAPGDDDNDTAAFRPGPGFGPTFPGDGDGSETLPTVPAPDTRGRSAFLGVSAAPSTDPDGARIVTVVPGSPAADGGLQEDDVITKVDDDEVTTPARLAAAIQDHERGDEVTITYLRDGSTHTAWVTLTLRNAFELPTPSTTRSQS